MAHINQIWIKKNTKNKIDFTFKTVGKEIESHW